MAYARFWCILILHVPKAITQYYLPDVFNEEAAKHDKQEDLTRNKMWFTQNVSNLYESVKDDLTREKMVLNADHE